MRRTREEAFAKINLTLEVLNLRPDGYHDLDMVMQSVSLSDTVTISLAEGAGVRVESSLSGLPKDRRNLAVDAAHRFLEAAELSGQGVSLSIQKRIPICAGTAGGSSDAAAVLRGLNRLTKAPLSLKQLLEIGGQVGSDVPFCIVGGTARAWGRGEVFTPLPPLPDCFIVLCKPDYEVSTPELFYAWDQRPPTRRPNTQRMLTALGGRNLYTVCQELHNVFEDLLPPEIWEEVIGIKKTLVEEGALGACMSGTGPTVFGIFPRQDLAEQARASLRARYKEVFLTKPV